MARYAVAPRGRIRLQMPGCILTRSGHRFELCIAHEINAECLPILTYWNAVTGIFTWARQSQTPHEGTLARSGSCNATSITRETGLLRSVSSEIEARKREVQLKTGFGRPYLKESPGQRIGLHRARIATRSPSPQELRSSAAGGVAGGGSNPLSRTLSKRMGAGVVLAS
jgi:hypothetical protein